MPTVNPAIMTNVELNKNLLNTLFKFQPMSKLKRFIMEKTGVEKNLYTLAEILTILKEVIRGEEMFDPKNPSIIICSRDLEAALNMKALHVTEIRDLVLNHIVKVPEQSLRSPTNGTPNNINNQVAREQQATQPRVVRAASISSTIYTDKNARFYLKEKFLNVVRSVEGTPQDQIIFTYEQVTLALSKYILSRKDHIFDPRNIKLALVENDPIGDAFGVKAFHRCQVNSLLRNQLIPVQNDSFPDFAVISTQGSPGVNALITEKPVQIFSRMGTGGVSSTTNSNSGSNTGSYCNVLPPFPALSKAHTMPAGTKSDDFWDQNERIRKRASSDEEDIDNRSKQARVANGAIFNDAVTHHADESYGTSDTEVENDDDTNQIEYEIDSGEEEERPPQAMGIGADFSSADDTDTDAEDTKFDERIANDIEAGVLSQRLESVYWGDSEDDIKTPKSDEELDFSDSGKSKKLCVSCQAPNNLKIPYCGKCWNIRKGWVPERPKYKKKTRTASEKSALILKKAIIESGTETDGGSGDRPRFDSKASICSQDSGIGSQEFEISSQGEECMKELGGTVTVNHASFSRSISLDSAKDKTSVGIDTLNLGDSASSTNLKSFPYPPSSSESLTSLESSTATSQLCLMCCQRPKNASLIHGRLGHQVCCYPCAKKLWKKRSRCPICRRKVERIIKLIQA